MVVIRPIKKIRRVKGDGRRWLAVAGRHDLLAPIVLAVIVSVMLDDGFFYFARHRARSSHSGNRLGKKVTKKYQNGKFLEANSQINSQQGSLMII